MFQNCFAAITFLILALGSFALLLASNVAMLGNNAANSNIFLLGINMSNLNSQALVSSLSSSETVAELGFANDYIFGMYGYCRGSSDSDTETVSSIFEHGKLQDASCSKSKAAYYVNPVQFAVDEINNHNTLGLTIDQNDIVLPGDLKTYDQTIKNVSYLMYITSIICIVATALSIVLYLLCFCCGGNLWVIFSQTIAFLTSVIYAGSFTGVYTYIRDEFNNNVSTFGIRAVLSYRFLAISWVGVGLSLLALLHVIFSGCCCWPSRPQYVKGPYGERIL